MSLAYIKAMKIRTVVLSSSSNALLRVDGSDELGQVRLRVGSAEEDRLVLVHTLYVSASLLSMNDGLAAILAVRESCCYSQRWRTEACRRQRG